MERAAEGCAAAMAGVLPADKVIQVLNPIIKTGDYPVNQAAVKMLTKVAEHDCSKEVVTAQLGSIMPGLLRENTFALIIRPTTNRPSLKPHNFNYLYIVFSFIVGL